MMIRTLIALAFAFVAFLRPGITFAALAFLFGGYSLVHGALVVVTGSRDRARAHTLPLALAAFVGVGIGATAITVSGMAATTLVYVMSLVAMVTGATEIVAAVRLCRRVAGEALLVVGGVASIELGILLLVVPIAAPLLLVVLLGGYAFMCGGALIVFAFRLQAAPVLASMR